MLFQVIEKLDLFGHATKCWACTQPASPLRRDALQESYRGENGMNVQASNHHTLLQQGSNTSFNPSEEGYLLPQKCIPAKITLILDLDETLVHSSFKPVANADFVVPVEVDGTVHRVFVSKRPGVDAFMKRVRTCPNTIANPAASKLCRPLADMCLSCLSKCPCQPPRFLPQVALSLACACACVCECTEIIPHPAHTHVCIRWFGDLHRSDHRKHGHVSRSGVEPI